MNERTDAADDRVVAAMTAVREDLLRHRRRTAWWRAAVALVAVGGLSLLVQGHSQRRLILDKYEAGEKNRGSAVAQINGHSDALAVCLVGPEPAACIARIPKP